MIRSRPARMAQSGVTPRRSVGRGLSLASLLIASSSLVACVSADSTGSPGSGGTSAGSGGGGTGGVGTGGDVGAGSGGTASGGTVGTGTGGAFGSGGATTTGGGGTGGRGSGGTGTAGRSGTGIAGAGGDSLCAPGRYIICEGFETTAPGTNVAPAGWARSGSVDVVADPANVYRGLHAMRINAAPNGARRITKTGADVTALGGSHWGRIFYKVQVPAPRPSSGVVHSTIVAGNAMSPVAGVPGNGNSEYRMVDTVEDSTGHHQFLYNVQRSGASQEFGNNRVPYNWTYDGQWHCAEWHIESATQNFHFYFDGAEVTQVAVTNGAGNYTNSEIPRVFTNLEVGWNNYQTSTPGFVAWIDEIAMDTNRIGCGN